MFKGTRILIWSENADKLTKTKYAFSEQKHWRTHKTDGQYDFALPIKEFNNAYDAEIPKRIENIYAGTMGAPGVINQRWEELHEMGYVSEDTVKNIELDLKEKLKSPQSNDQKLKLEEQILNLNKQKTYKQNIKCIALALTNMMMTIKWDLTIIPDYLKVMFEELNKSNACFINSDLDCIN